MKDLKGKVILIPGADGGVGREFIKTISNMGAKLVLGSVIEKDIKEMSEALQLENCEAAYQQVDVTNEESVKSFMEFAHTTYGALDILLNLPGLSIPGQISDMLEADYDKTMDVSVKGSFLMSKHFVGFANIEESPLIINIGSMASKNANGNAPIYCTAKAAVAMFSQGLALQVKDKNIRVATINPGGISTSFWGDRKVPHEKLMQVQDMAEVLVFVMTRSARVMVTDLSFESFELFKGK